MSARHALAHSVNIPAVRVLNELGVARAADYLAAMGLDVPDEDKTLALALGGMSEGFCLPELADAYATFAQEGTFAPSSSIRRVTDKSGRVLYEHSPRSRRVFSKDVAWLTNDMLMTAAKEGTAKRLRQLPFPVCAKTGTAEVGENSTPHSWERRREIRTHTASVIRAIM